MYTFQGHITTCMIMWIYQGCSTTWVVMHGIPVRAVLVHVLWCRSVRALLLHALIWGHVRSVLIHMVNLGCRSVRHLLLLHYDIDLSGLYCYMHCDVNVRDRILALWYVLVWGGLCQQAVILCGWHTLVCDASHSIQNWLTGAFDLLLTSFWAAN